MKGKRWGIVAALVVVVALVSSITAMVLAAGEGVNQVSATVSAAKINPNQTVTTTITVLTGTSTDTVAGTVTIYDPSSNTSTYTLTGGTGTRSEDTTAFPGVNWTGANSTAATGTYKITATINSVTYGTEASPLATFEVQTYVVSASPSRIAIGNTTTISVQTGEPSWSATITVTDPSSNTSTASVSSTTASVIYPTDFSGTPSPSTGTKGVYTISLGSASPAGTDTSYFDVLTALSPHQGTGFTTITAACAGCHRTHTGAAPKLLKSSNQYLLCTSCHDGTGANTNVEDGVYLGSTQGTQNAGLRGGGFVYALMDTDLDGSMTSTAITSKHTVATTSPVVWGSGSLGDNDAGEVISAFECGSCHNPHGNSQYRMLKRRPTGLVADAPGADVTVPDESPVKYTISYDSNNRRDLGQYPVGVLSQMTEWCGQCHQRYEAGGGSGSTSRGDTVFNYSHMTEGLGGECLKCHVAHGTSASMTGNAASSEITWPANTATPWQGTETNYSRLLHIDNRGVCMQCHTTSELTSN